MLLRGSGWKSAVLRVRAVVLVLLFSLYFYVLSSDYVGSGGFVAHNAPVPGLGAGNGAAAGLLSGDSLPDKWA